MNFGVFQRMQCDGCRIAADVPTNRSLSQWGELSVDIQIDAPGSLRHQWTILLDLCPLCLAALAENGRLNLAHSGAWSPEQRHDIGEFVLGMVRDFLDECLRRGYPQTRQKRQAAGKDAV